MTSSRENNSLIRIKLAEWTRTFRREKFIMGHLIKQGISIRKVMCPAMLANGTMCILKRFKKIAGGGVGLVWGCGRCRGGPSIIEELRNNSTSKTFGGQCRVENYSGDVNKLIILPEYVKNFPPRISQSRSEFLQAKGKMLERTVFDIVQ